MANVRDKVLEFAKLASECPENLQVVCFELLLKHHLDSISPRAARNPVQKNEQQEKNFASSDTEKPTVEQTAQSQDDLTATDLHVKAKHFLKKYGISIDELNNLFYKEKGDILPLYEDLKTTRMSESQVRIAMLQSLRESLTTGNFEADVEEIRVECNDRKCYAKGNFPANFSNNATLFDFDKFAKGTTKVKLSEDGKKELAEIIRELQ